MKRRPHAFRPEASILETKILLSLASGPKPQLAEVSTLAARASQSPAINALRGRYLAPEDMRAADAPLVVKLGGAGPVQGLGRVRASGSLELGGFRVANQPDIQGVLTLSSARGSVTLKLTGYGGYSEVPGGRFVTSASIVKGTGAFANIRRTGTATIEFGPNTVRAVRAPSPMGGLMTLTFDLQRPSR